MFILCHTPSDATRCHLQSLAKLLSRHVASHSTRIERASETIIAMNRSVAQDVAKMAMGAQSACAEASNGTVRWAGESKGALTGLLESQSTNASATKEVRDVTTMRPQIMIERDGLLSHWYCADRCSVFVHGE